MPYATISDVRAVLGRPWASADEEGQASAWLEEASALVDENVPGAAARAAAVAGFAAAVKYVIRDAVRRAIDNPQGLSSEAQDDYRATRPVDGSRPVLYLLPAEVSRLTSWGARAAGYTPGGAMFVSVSG